VILLLNLLRNGFLILSNIYHFRRYSSGNCKIQLIKFVANVDKINFSPRRQQVAEE